MVHAGDELKARTRISVPTQKIRVLAVARPRREPFITLNINTSSLVRITLTSRIPLSTHHSPLSPLRAPRLRGEPVFHARKCVQHARDALAKFPSITPVFDP